MLPSAALVAAMLFTLACGSGQQGQGGSGGVQGGGGKGGSHASGSGGATSGSGGAGAGGGKGDGSGGNAGGTAGGLGGGGPGTGGSPGTGGGPGMGGKAGALAGGSGGRGGANVAGAGGGASAGSGGHGTGGAGGAPTSGSPCEANSDCGSNGYLFCAAPGESAGCGNCRRDPGNCTSDTDCGGSPDGGVAVAHMICDLAPSNQCYCTSTSVCQIGCRAKADCIAGQGCNPHHQCQDTCTPGGTTCPTNFSCSSDGFCVQNTCTTDSQCSGACVKGSCYSTRGQCQPRAA